MPKKSTLLKEIGNVVNNNYNNINVFDINFDILKSLNLKMMNLEDSRHSSYDLHYMNEIVIIVFLALLSNCDEWTQIHMFAVQHEQWLHNFLKLPYGLPSISTIKRVIAMVDPKDLETICVEFIYEKTSEIERELHIENKKDIISLDGKEINSSGRNNSINGKIDNMQAMSAYSSKYDMTLATEFIEEKTNEIPTGPKLLSRLNLENTIITFDALNTQEKTIQYIVKNKGDYVAPVKANQGTLYEDLKAYFDSDELKKEANCYSEKEKAHSQIEVRDYYLISDTEWISNKNKWSKLASIGVVEKTISNLITGEVKKEVRYYITSLYDSDLKEFAQAVRSEWEIENNLHWHLDVTFKEDRNLTSEKTAQKNLNILRKLGLNILKMAQPLYKLSLKNIRLQLCMNFEDEFYKILTLLDKEKIIELIKSSKM